MNDLLKDWILFSEGKRDFEKSHFLGLFKNQLNEKQLLSVFAGIPSGATLYQRTKNVLDSSSLDSYLYFQPKSDANRLLMVSAAKTWLEELSRFCVDRGNSKLHGIVAGSRVVVQDRKSFQMPISSDTPAGWMLSFVGDEVDYALGDVGPVIDGLMEALYGIAADYYLCWYVMMPMIPLSLNFDPYFSIWSQGARPVLTEDALVLLVETDGGCRRAWLS